MFVLPTPAGFAERYPPMGSTATIDSGVGKAGMSAETGTLFRALEHRDFRLLWSAQILSELGDWAARVALAVLVHNRTGSKVLTAAVTGVGLLPWIGLGQALAALRRPVPASNGDDRRRPRPRGRCSSP